MPARRASSDSSASATPNSLIHRDTGDPILEIHHSAANPGRAPPRIPSLAVISPDIRHQERLRLPHIHNLRATLALGPGRSPRPLQLATTAAFVLGGGLLIWS